MSIGEVKLVVLLSLALLLLVGGGYSGLYLAHQHYLVIEGKEQAASDAVLATAQQSIINLTTERDALLAQEAKNHAALVASDTATRESLDAGMRNLASTVHGLAVSLPVAASAGGSGTSAGAGGGGTLQDRLGKLDGLLAEFGAATDNLVGACQHDSREVTGILQVAPQLQPKGTP
jgi:hypothetical protein